MNDMLYLGWRYIAFHRWKTTVLVLAITLVVFLPATLNILVERSAQQLTARAEATPLLIGAQGSPLELALNSLYFDGGAPAVMRYADTQTVQASGLAQPVPLYARFTASGFPIVGTTPDYLAFRQLQLASGRPVVMLGEAVIGAEVARELGLSVGDGIVSSPESAFNLAGVYPLKMTVVGILAPAFSADDNAVFTDIKTTWIIEGLGHGHQDLEQKEAAAAVISRANNTIVANASLVQYNEITAENADSFHFHGDTSGYPINGIIVVPNDDKSGIIFQGRMQNTEGGLQIINPREVIDALLGTVFTVQQYVIAAVTIVGGATVMLAILVFLLSLRLRKRERLTLFKIGGSRGVIAGMMGAEIIAVIVTSSLLALLLTLLMARYGTDLFRSVLLS
jgi:putative ABC transport system permease protein